MLLYGTQIKHALITFYDMLKLGYFHPFGTLWTLLISFHLHKLVQAQKGFP